MAVGFIATNFRLISGTQPTDTTLLWVELALPAFILPIAFVSTLLSVRMTNLWVRLPRPEVEIAEGLKGIGNKTVFYSYYHFPARHVLITPQGVFAIVTRFQSGVIINEGNKWRVPRMLISRILSFFRFDNIGNPTIDALAAAAHVKTMLAEIAPDVPVYPVIVFVDKRVKLTLTNPDVPVVHAQNTLKPGLKDYVKSIPKTAQKTLTSEQITHFETLSKIEAS